MDAGNDHCCDVEVEGGVVHHPASDGRQMQADVVEQRYRRLVDRSPDAIAVHEGGRVVYINPAGVRWIGAQSSAELVGHAITEFVHPDSVPAMLAPNRFPAARGGTSPPWEAVMLRFDGTTLDVEAVSVLTVWEGRPAHQVIFRDLSAQKDAEAALRCQAALATHVSDAIIATTFTGISPIGTRPLKPSTADPPQEHWHSRSARRSAPRWTPPRSSPTAESFTAPTTPRMERHWPWSPPPQ